MANRGINKVMLIGNLGQDPEIRYMPNGGAVANLSLATSESWRDKQSGEMREKTEWHKVVIFGKMAEIAGEYLRKGVQVYIEGSLQTRKWQDQKGQDRYSTEVVVNMGGTMQMLGVRNVSQEAISKNNSERSDEEPKQQIQQFNNNSSSIVSHFGKSSPVLSPDPVIDFDDEIPF